MNAVLGYLGSYVYLFGVIIGITLLQRFFKFSTELSRKMIHILIGATWLILYHAFWPNWQILIVPISFIIINALSYKFKLFSAIERSDDGKNHLGTVYFSIAITGLFVLALCFENTIMSTGIAVFCLCFGDGFAAIIGTLSKHPIMIRESKSLQGTIACMISAGVGILLFSIVMQYPIPISVLLILSVATGLLELVGHGLDNFSITFGIYLLVSSFMYCGVLA